MAALALFTYALCFSAAYASTPAATGALLLFGAVQISLIGHGLWQGERLSRRQLAGLLLPHGAGAGREAIGIAVISGAVSSALGYALWYQLLPRLAAIEAASVQLSVPVLTAVGAACWLGERLSPPALIAGAVALVGIGLILSAPRPPRSARGTHTFLPFLNRDTP